MLEPEESKEAAKIYSEAFKGGGLSAMKESLLEYYNRITGFGETNANAVMHHIVGIYGPPCERCGKPYRTPKAKLCAACGHKRVIFFELGK